MESESPRDWWVYIIRCSDESLYTGVTVDLLRRWRQHANGNGAKYFRGRQPIELVYVETDHCRRSACQREFAIKQLSRRDKQLLLEQFEMSTKVG